MGHDGQYWNQKYAEGLPSLTRPDPFFLHAYERHLAAVPKPATALDVAGGLGRHALYLAQDGWDVTVVDISDVAIGKLGERAASLRLSLQLHVGKAEDLAPKACCFDTVVLFYHLDRRLFPSLIAALRPGGLLVCKARMRTHMRLEEVSAGSEALLGPGELVTLAASLEVLEHQERPIPIADCGVVEYIGRKRAKATP